MAVYRNLQEQVFENTKDIEQLQSNKHYTDEEIISLVDPVIDDKIADISRIETRDVSGSGSEIIIHPDGSVVLSTTNNLNSEHVLKSNYLSYEGEFLEYLEGRSDGPIYRYTLPKHTGTLALIEDLPVNTGTLKIGNTEITEEQLQKLLQLIQV